MSDLRRIGPGVYIDAAQTLHVDIPEMLRHYGYPDNATNRAAMCEVAADVLRELCGGKPIDLTFMDEPLPMATITRAELMRRLGG